MISPANGIAGNVFLVQFVRELFSSGQVDTEIQVDIWVVSIPIFQTVWKHLQIYIPSLLYENGQGLRFRTQQAF